MVCEPLFCLSSRQVGRKTYAIVSGRSTGHSLASELVESNDGHEEILKVYLKGRSGDKMVHEKNINQLKSEVQYIQEARSCLQKLREDISSKLDRDPEDALHRQETQMVLEKPNGFSQDTTSLYSSPPEVDTSANEDVDSWRRTVQELLAKLQEAERQHQSDRAAFEVTLSRYQREAEQSNVALQREEDRVEQKEVEIGELQRRLLGMETVMAGSCSQGLACGLEGPRWPLSSPFPKQLQKSTFHSSDSPLNTLWPLRNRTVFFPVVLEMEAGPRACWAT